MDGNLIITVIAAAVGTLVLLGLGGGVGFWVGLHASAAGKTDDEGTHDREAWALERSVLLDELKRHRQAEPSASEPAAPSSSSPANDDGSPAKAANESSSQPAPLAGASARRDFHLTSDEINEVIGWGEQVGEALADQEARRYPYDCVQQMAPWHDGRPLPKIDQLTPVRCHDISVSGISFLWPDKPKFDTVVISVGTGSEMVFMAAEVRHYRAVYMHEQVSHLVGCRFIRRLDDFARSWSDEQRSRDAACA